MATLSTEVRQRVTSRLQEFWSGFNEPVAILVADDYIATINAIDDWIEANQASFNSALPSIAQTNLTAEQKTLMFCLVAAARVGADFLSKLVGR